MSGFSKVEMSALAAQWGHGGDGGADDGGTGSAAGHDAHRPLRPEDNLASTSTSTASSTGSPRNSKRVILLDSRAPRSRCARSSVFAPAVRHGSRPHCRDKPDISTLGRSRHFYCVLTRPPPAGTAVVNHDEHDRRHRNIDCLHDLQRRHDPERRAQPVNRRAPSAGAATASIRGSIPPASSTTADPDRGAPRRQHADDALRGTPGADGWCHHDGRSFAEPVRASLFMERVVRTSSVRPVSPAMTKRWAGWKARATMCRR